MRLRGVKLNSSISSTAFPCYLYITASSNRLLRDPHFSVFVQDPLPNLTMSFASNSAAHFLVIFFTLYCCCYCCFGDFFYFYEEALEGLRLVEVGNMKAKVAKMFQV